MTKNNIKKIKFLLFVRRTKKVFICLIFQFWADLHSHSFIPPNFLLFLQFLLFLSSSSLCPLFFSFYLFSSQSHSLSLFFLLIYLAYLSFISLSSSLPISLPHLSDHLPSLLIFPPPINSQILPYLYLYHLKTLKYWNIKISKY